MSMIQKMTEETRENEVRKAKLLKKDWGVHKEAENLKILKVMNNCDLDGCKIKKKLKKIISKLYFL